MLESPWSFSAEEMNALTRGILGPVVNGRSVKWKEEGVLCVQNLCISNSGIKAM